MLQFTRGFFVSELGPVVSENTTTQPQPFRFFDIFEPLIKGSVQKGTLIKLQVKKTLRLLLTCLLMCLPGLRVGQVWNNCDCFKMVLCFILSS